MAQPTGLKCMHDTDDNRLRVLFDDLHLTMLFEAFAKKQNQQKMAKGEKPRL